MEGVRGKQGREAIKRARTEQRRYNHAINFGQDLKGVVYGTGVNLNAKPEAIYKPSVRPRSLDEKLHNNAQ